MNKLLWVTWLLGALSLSVQAEIVIGQSADIGGTRKQGPDMVAGAKAYFDTVNAQGGVRGQKIKLVVLDDGGKSDRAKANTDELITQHKAMVLFGYSNRVTAEVGMAAANETRTVFFAPGSGGETLRLVPSRYVFHVRAGYAAEYRKIVDTMAGTGVRSFGFVVNADDTKNSNRQALENALSIHGLKASVTAALPRGDASFAEISEAVLKAKPDVLILAASGKSLPLLVKDLRSRGYGGRFATISFLISSLPADLDVQAHGLIVTNVVPPPSRIADKLVSDARRDLQLMDPNVQISSEHLEGYMSARVLVEGLRRATAFNPEALVTALESMSQLNLSAKIHVGFSPNNHNGGNFVDIAIVGYDGRLIY